METKRARRAPKAATTRVRKELQYEADVQPTERCESVYDRESRFDGLNPESFSHMAFYSLMWE